MQDERERFAKAQDAERMVSLIGQLRAFAEQQTKFAERSRELNNDLLYLVNSCGHEITQAARLGNEAMNIWSRLTKDVKKKKPNKKKPKRRKK